MIRFDASFEVLREAHCGDIGADLSDVPVSNKKPGDHSPGLMTLRSIADQMSVPES